MWFWSALCSGRQGLAGLRPSRQAGEAVHAVCGAGGRGEVVTGAIHYKGLIEIPPYDCSENLEHHQAGLWHLSAPHAPTQCEQRQFHHSLSCTESVEANTVHLLLTSTSLVPLVRTQFIRCRTLSVWADPMLAVPKHKPCNPFVHARCLGQWAASVWP